MLSVSNRVGKTICEFLDCTEKIWTDKVDHAVILVEVILHRSTSENHSTVRMDLPCCLGNGGFGVFQQVALVGDDQVWCFEKELFELRNQVFYFCVRDGAGLPG